jgi:hypothetical protein
MFLLKRLDDFQNRITQIPSAKYQLEARVILPKEALQPLLHEWFHPAQWLQDGYRGQIAVTQAGYCGRRAAEANGGN